MHGNTFEIVIEKREIITIKRSGNRDKQNVGIEDKNNPHNKKYHRMTKISTGRCINKSSRTYMYNTHTQNRNIIISKSLRGIFHNS